MALPRRALLIAPILAGFAHPARAASFAMLRPHFSSELGMAPLPGERLAFRAAGLEPAIAFPGARARIVQMLPTPDRQLVVLGFAADPAGAGRLDLGAIVGWDGVQMRVLGLEVLLWQAPGGAWLGTRLRMTGDRSRLLLLRDAAAPRGGRPWLRESWTDTMRWREGAALADEPPRPPPAATWQSRFENIRARVADRLAAPCIDVAEDLLGLLAPANLPPS